MCLQDEKTLERREVDQSRFHAEALLEPRNQRFHIAMLLLETVSMFTNLHAVLLPLA